MEKNNLLSGLLDASPERIAIEHNKIKYTYKELVQKVELLASRLQEHNITSGSLVGVYLDRSVYTIVSILSIWKVGGVYVPLNKLLPEQHISHIIASSQIEFILVDAEASFRLNDPTVEIININSEMNKAQEYGQKTLNHSIAKKSSGQQPAYIIHTSGTTGTPKGIIVSHDNINNYLAWCHEQFQSTELNRCLFSGAVSFDISLMEILSTLFFHGTLVILDSVLDVVKTDEYSPTSMFVTPSGFGELLIQERVPSSLQTLVLGGEVLTKNMASRIIEKGIRLINAYGPSETTILAASHIVTRDSLKGTSVPVGQPIPNTVIKILNSENEICNEGEIGELVIYGKSVSLGYTNQESNNNAFGYEKQTGESFYRSGDLGFYNSDGLIEVCGRKDTQVKLRGYRIDLNGLATIMEKQDVIEKSCFLVERNENVDVLHAFIRLKNNTKINEDIILKTYKDEVPGYCVPNQIHIVESFPLNHSGKLDTNYLLSRTQQKQTRKQINESLHEDNLNDFIVLFLRKELNNPLLNEEDHFYQVGCNSLLGMRLSIELQKKFGCTIQITDLFELGTPKEVATHFDLNRCDQVITKLDNDMQCEEMQLCSTAQKRLLYLNQKLDSTDSYFNEYYVFEIKGLLNIEKLEESLRIVIKRHIPLNITYSISDGEMWQKYIEDDFKISVQQITEHMTLDKHIRSEISRGFNLLKDRSIRCTLYKQPASCICIINIHHIAFDGISEEIFFSELSESYESLLLNKIPSLNPVPISYYNYCAYEKSWFNTLEYQTSLKYWQETLINAPHVHSIPLDRRREKTQHFSGSRYSSKLSLTSISRLKNICQASNTTLFTGFYSILCLVIEKYSFEKEICVGTPVANRIKAEFSNLIGFFVNTVPLFVDLNQTETFKEVLEKCSKVILGALKHQRIPLTDIINVLDIDRDTSYPPLLQTLLVYEEEKEELLKIPGCTITKNDYYNNKTQFDLTFIIREKKNDFELIIEYDHNLFDESSIAALGSLYTIILNHFVSSPKASAFNVPLLKRTELPDLKDNFHDNLPFSTVTEWFEEIALRQPDTIALSKDNVYMTYHELNEQANKLAHYLSKVGIESGMVVCILFERSVHSIVSLLAVMKVGAAYLPLEATVPKKRLEHIINSTQLGFILTDRYLEEIDGEFKAINLKDASIDEKIKRHSSGNLPKHKTNLAYVLFTSGTTGQPKGAKISHKAILSHVYSAHEQYKMNYATVTLQYSSLSFDVATSDILCSLTCGGRLHLIDKNILYSSKRLSDEIERERITHINIASSSLSTIEIRESYALQTINIGGEVCPEDLIEKWKGLCELYISYGPTECAVCTSSISINQRKEENSIGKPIGANMYFVCDYYGNVVPDGVPGYLYIAGPQVMEGYVDSRNSGISYLTYDANSIKVYNSNDIVRRMPSGEYQFLGRKDGLVKINGHRISLSEITNAAGKKEYIRKVSVMVTKLANASSAIILFVQLETSVDQKKQINTLKSDLADELPTYMIPSRIIPINKIPLTVNGKTDYNKLNSIQESSSEHIEPVQEESFTNLESGVLNLWIELLGEGIPKEINCSFFSVGGNSLLYIKLLNNIRVIYGIDFTLEEISRLQTVREMAKEIEGVINKKKVVISDLDIKDEDFVEEW